MSASAGAAPYAGGPFLAEEVTLPPDEEFAFPLSPAQERMWEADQACPGDSAYNTSFRWQLIGSVNLRTLERAFNQIVRRHEILRATFREIDGAPAQIIAPSLRLKITFKDIRSLPAPQKLSQMDRLCLEEAQRSFDLQKGPLVRAGLLHIENEEFVLMFTLHHIVCDGWSIGLIMEELQSTYASLAEGREPPLPELAIQYPDYVIWQREMVTRPETQRQLEYWRNKLSRYQRLEVPTDFPRPLGPTTRSTIVSEMLPRELSDAVKRFSDEHNATLFITSLAVCMALLSRHTGLSDIAVGSPLAGRSRAELETLVGLFVNHVVLRASAEGDPLFPQFLDRVRETVWEAFANQDIPFEKAVESLARDGTQPPKPFFNVNFICQREYARASTFVFDFAGVRMRTMPSKSQGALYDLNFFMVEREAGWRLSLEYKTELYSEKTAEAILRDFRAMLEAVGSNPNRRLSDFPLSAIIPPSRTKHSIPATVSQAKPESEARAADFRTRQELYAMPASAAQKRFWVLQNLFPASPMFQLPACLHLAGPVSEQVLEESFQRVIDRHEILRTTFDEIDGELAQIVAPSAAFSLPVTTVEGVPEQRRESHLRELIRGEAQQLCDLRRGPFLRGRLFRIGPQEHVLTITAHHLVADGWSQGIFQKELWSIYEALIQNREPELPDLAIQYGDFAAWQKDWLETDEVKAHLNFWMNQLAAPLPVLDLPSDGSPGDRLPPRGAIETLLLPASLTASLKTMVQAESATMFTLLLTGFASLLARISGQEEVLVGSPVANRRGETELSIGPFSGPIALRLNFSGDPSLREAVNRVRDVTLEVLAHSDLPFETVLEKLTPRSVRGRNPLFQFYFLYQTAFLQPRQVGELTVAPLPTFSIGTPFEMQCAAIERSEGLRLQLEYNPGLYESSTIRKRLQDFERVLQSFVANPDLRLSEIPIASESATSRKSDTGKERYVEPRDHLEAELAGIWESVLGLERIGVRDDFFDLGGHSLLATRLLKTIEARLGAELSIASLLDASTIERQAQLIRPPSKSARQIETEQTEAQQIPFFYLGAYPTFRRLTRLLGRGRQFHSLGMQDSMYRELGPAASMQSIAAHFVRVLRERHPHGPYMLGGWCSHGVLALEIAHQLRAQGEDVPLVVMIEGPNPPARLSNARWKRFIAGVQLKFSLARFEYSYLEQVKWNEALTYIGQRIAAKVDAIKRALLRCAGRIEFAQDKSPINLLYRATDRYIPNAYPDPVLLMRGTVKSFGFAQDLRLGWGDLLPGLIVEQTNGSHFSIMGAGSEELARKILARMQQAEQRYWAEREQSKPRRSSGVEQ
ncbi:MAG TPA: condensation domain-containing protein [Candidatus Acidoferrum sp.]|nr:condensation domain-containing protein [Candidatus Acidoferrum sp.]